MAAREIPDGVMVTYSRQYRRCGKAGCTQCRGGAPGHGPYWYAYWREGGKRRSRYLGRTAPAGITETADTRQNAESPPAADAGPAAKCPQAPAVVAAQQADVPGLRVQTLGIFAVWRLGRRIADAQWGKRRAGAVLKCLLSAPDQRLSREQLTEWLWPELDADTGARNLRQALHQARHALASPLPQAGESAWLHDLGDLVVLAPEAPGSRAGGADPTRWLDAAAFDLAATHALAVRDAARCRAALALHTGAYLPEDRGEPWAEGPRRRLEQHYHHLLLHLADLCATHGESAAAEEHLRTLLAADSLHEEAAARLMTLLASQSKRSEALRIYQAFATALEEELGVEPGEEVQEIRSRLLAALAAPPMAARPPRRPLPDRPTNLPASLTTTVGRVWERAEVARLLRGDAAQGRSPCRLLSLTGVGGVGKTRLALEVGAALLGNYPDGVWLVELAAIPAREADDPTPVVQVVATALGIKEEAHRSLLERLIESVRPRELLLLLDNCEHLSRACATLAAGLLRECPGLSILVTSRASLGMPGEVLWTVPLLAVPPEGIVDRDTVMQYEAIQLFVERGKAARVDFVLTQRHAAAVAQICRRLDGIPLAIELAAARLQFFGVQEVAARLDDCFRLLIGASRTVLPRQQTLRSSLEWSYSLLDNREQVLLRSLSVFAGGWTLAAAEAVCADEVVPASTLMSCLGNLVRHSLVLLRPEGEPARYRLLEPIRQYAAERLAATSEQTTMQDQHLAWCVDLAEEAEPHLRGAKQTVWLEWLEAEHDNLRAALRWSVGKGSGGQGLQLAGALWRFYYLRGYFTEGRGWLMAVLAQDGTIPVPVALRARALNGAGNLAEYQGDYARAAALHEESLALRRALGDSCGIAGSLNNLGNLAERQGDHVRATVLHEESLALHRTMGEKHGVASSLGNLGIVAKRQGDYRRAAALFDESLAVRRALGDGHGTANALSGLGTVAEKQGDHTRAAALHEESLALYRELGDKRGAAMALQNRGTVAEKQGDYARAAALHEESLVLYRELGDRLGMGEAMEGLARLTGALGQPRRGAHLWGAADALRQTLGTPREPSEQIEYEQCIVTLRTILGKDAFTAIWATGQAMPMGKAVALALEVVPCGLYAPRSPDRPDRWLLV